MANKNARRSKSLTISKKRKQKTKDRVDVKHDFRIKSIADNWDKTKTLKQNYANLGLETDVNKIAPRMEVLHQVNDVPPVEPKGILADELKNIEKSTPVTPYQIKSMNLNEQRILIKLMQKYGENFEDMARDIKINIHQFTSSQLRKRIDLLKQLQTL